MLKKKSGFLTKIVFAVIAHPWIKIISLALAVMIWFYARSEISRFNY
ncbi:MAG: hypothetical protein NTY47_00165 [Candidatus Omnitrophica bacterium]|nr:hypothetical protein [Candidatus Omnitrophota bacterium]